MRAFALVAGLLLLTAPAVDGQPLQRLDRAQGDSALRMISEGDAVRFYCQPCGDVVYTEVRAASRQLRPFGGGYRLSLNGELVDPAEVYLDSGYGDGWENLAALLGLVAERAADRLPATLAADHQLHPSTGFYIGTLGDARVQMSLQLRDRRLEGSWLDEEPGGRPALRLLATRFRASSVRAGGHGAVATLLERDDEDQIRGTLSAVFDGAEPTLKGTWASLDGTSLPFALRRVADYVTRTQVRDGLRSHVVYPRWRGVPAQVLNERFATAAAQAEHEFLAEWTPQAPSGGEVWWQRHELTLAYYQPDLVSLWRTVRRFTGGVRGALEVGAENHVQRGEAFVPFTLMEGFRPGTAVEERLSTSVLGELRRRRVSWVVNGQVRHLDAAALTAFTVSPQGLTFALPPRAELELWRRSVVTATVPFAEVRPLIDPAGPLGRLLPGS